MFNVTLQNYAEQTGMKLSDTPIAKQLESCDSVDSISSVLQEHAWKFTKSQGDDGRIMKCLKRAIHVLYTFSTSTALGEAISLVCPRSLIVILCS